MVAEQATNGQSSGQETQVSEGGDAGGDKSSGGGGDDRLSRIEARFDLLQDTVSEFTRAVAESRRQQTTVPVVEEIDDDEPLTASKVKKIVQSSVSTVAAQSRTLSERDQWDAKAKSEFPLDDPKFQLEVKREWREQVAGGLDPNHPRALYNVAQITARTWNGAKKQRPQEAETTLSSETSSNPSPRRNGGSPQSKISDDDPRVRFYAMKHGKNPDKIKAFKDKLGAKDAPRRGR